MKVLAPTPTSAITAQVADGYQLCARCGEVLVEGESAVVVPRAPFWFIYSHEIGPNCPPKAVKGWKAVRAAEGIRKSENLTIPREAEPVHHGGLAFPCACLLDDKHIEAEVALVQYYPSDESPANRADVRELLWRGERRMSRSCRRAVTQSSLDDFIRGTSQSVVRNAVEDDLIALIDTGDLNSVTNALKETSWLSREKSYATGRLAPATDPFPHAFVDATAQVEVRIRQRRKGRLPKASADVLTCDANGRPAEFALYSKRKVLKRGGKWISELEAWGAKPEPIGLPYNSSANPELYTWQETPQSKCKPVRHWPMGESQKRYGPVAVLKPEALAALNAQRKSQFCGENIIWNGPNARAAA
jgi:hypothetical protein